MRNKPAELPYLRHPCVAESCRVDLPQTHSHSFQGFTHGRKLQEGVPAPAPGPAASRRAEARPMPPLPPLPAGAPEPGAAAGAQVWTSSYETRQMAPVDCTSLLIISGRCCPLGMQKQTDLLFGILRVAWQRCSDCLQKDHYDKPAL